MWGLRKITAAMPCTAHRDTFDDLRGLSRVVEAWKPGRANGPGRAAAARARGGSRVRGGPMAGVYAQCVLW